MSWEIRSQSSHWTKIQHGTVFCFAFSKQFCLVQFNLGYFCIAQYHKLRICLRGLYNLYTYENLLIQEVFMSLSWLSWLVKYSIFLHFNSYQIVLTMYWLCGTLRFLDEESLTNIIHYYYYPWPLTSHQEKIKKINFPGKKWRNLQESNRGGSLSRMDRRIEVMWPEGIITELQHVQWVWQCMNSW